MRSFHFRIILPAVLSIVLLCWTIFSFLLPSFEETLITRKKQLVQELVNTAHSVLEEYKEREDSGELSREEAQLRAKNRISHMRYGDDSKDYFWINTMEPRMVMHPYRPDLVGENLSKYKDPRGKHLFVEAVVIVSKQGSGFVDYMWQWKDDPERIVQKVSYVKGFEPWGWIIGSGIYIEDVHAEISLITRRLSLILTGILFLTALLIVFIIWQGMKSEQLKLSSEINLRSSEKKYRELVQNANSIILRLDRKGTVLFINEFAQEFFGFTEYETIGKSVIGTIVPEISSAGENLEKFIADLCAAPHKFLSNENENIKKNGERVWIAWANKAVLNKTGEVEAVLCVGNDITKRKKTEQALYESEERIRTVVDQAGDAFFLLDDSGSFIDVNKHACEILGYTRDEMAHMSVLDIDLEFTSERIRELIKTLELGNIITLESIHRTKDGKRFPVEIRCRKSIIHGSVKIIVLSRDITDRKLMEEALQKNEKKYRGLYNNAQVGMSLTAVSDGKMIECNNKLVNIFGFETREQFISEFVSSDQYVDPQERQTLIEALEKKGVVNDYIVQLYRRDKTRVWVRISFSLYHDIDCIESVVVDITEQKQAEQALKEREYGFQKLFDNMTNAVVVYEAIDQGQDFVFKDLNNAVQKSERIKKEDLIGKHLSEMFTGVKDSGLLDVLQRVYETGKPEYLPEMAYKDERLGEVWRENWAYKLPTGEIVCMYNDVTERKKIQLETIRTARLASIGELSAGVAHEVNNPLNGIINCAELLTDILSEQSLDTKWADAIIRESQRIAKIVRSLLSYARPSDEEKGAFVIKNILDEMFLLLKKMFEKDSVTLSVEISEHLSKVYVQPQKIQEVFMNIMINSLYAMNQKFGSEYNKKCMEISTEEVELENRRYVRIVFTDNGIGIPADSFDRICDPFYSLKPAGEASGLGLNICYNIIEDHGGKLLIESKDGQYTRVMVDLPAALN